MILQTNPFKYTLGHVNQRKGVDYVNVEDGCFRCLLCDTGVMTTGTAKAHFNGRRHEKKWRALKVEQEEERRSIIENAMLTRVNRLGHDSWREHMDELMKQYIYLGNNGIDRFSKAHSVLSKYELMEKTSLLELAIVKQNICDQLTFSTMQEVIDYQALEEGFDQTEFLNSRRITCGSDVIIRNVMPFLGGWKKESP